MHILFIYAYLHIYIYTLGMGGLTEKLTFSVSSLYHETTLKFFTKPKSFSLVLSDHIQENTVEKDFQILIKSNFISIYSIVRRKDGTKIW